MAIKDIVGKIANGAKDSIKAKGKELGGRVIAAAGGDDDDEIEQEAKKTAKILKQLAYIINLLIQAAAAVVAFIIANLIWILLALAVTLIVIIILYLFVNKIDDQIYYRTVIGNNETDSIKNIWTGVYYESYADKSLYFAVEPVKEEAWNQLDDYLKYGKDSGYNIDEFNEKMGVQDTDDGNIVQSGSKTANDNYNNVKDIDNLEENLKLSFGTLSVLDEKLNGEYIYPAQFTKPLYADCVVNDDYSYESIKKCKVMSNEDFEAESVFYDKTFTDGVADNEGYYSKMLDKEKSKDLSQYGLGSIVLYNSYVEPSRISGNRVNYLKYQNPNWEPGSNEKLWITYGGGDEGYVMPSNIKEVENMMGSELKYASTFKGNNTGQVTDVESEITYNDYNEVGDKWGATEQKLRYETENAADAMDNPPTEERIKYAITSAVTPFGTINFNVNQEWMTVAKSNASNTFYTEKTGVKYLIDQFEWKRVGEPESKGIEYYGPGKLKEKQWKQRITEEYELVIPDAVKNFNEQGIEVYMLFDGEYLRVQDGLKATYTYYENHVYYFPKKKEDENCIEKPGAPCKLIDDTDGEPIAGPVTKYSQILIHGGVKKDYQGYEKPHYVYDSYVSGLDMLRDHKVDSEAYVFQNYQTMQGDLQYFLVYHEGTSVEGSTTDYLENYIKYYTAYIPVTDDISEIDSATGEVLNTDGNEGYYCKYSQHDFDTHQLSDSYYGYVDSEEANDVCYFGVYTDTTPYNKDNNTGNQYLIYTGGEHYYSDDQYGGHTGQYFCKNNIPNKITTASGLEIDYAKPLNEDGNCDKDYIKQYYDGKGSIVADNYNSAVREDGDGSILDVEAGRTIKRGNDAFFAGKTDMELKAYGEIVGYKERVDGSFALAEKNDLDINYINTKEVEIQEKINRFINNNTNFLSRFANQFGIDEKLLGTLVYYQLEDNPKGEDKSSAILKDDSVKVTFTPYSGESIKIKDVYHLTGKSDFYIFEGTRSIESTVTLKLKDSYNEFQVAYAAAMLSQGLSYFRGNTLMAVGHVLYEEPNVRGGGIDNVNGNSSLIYNAIKLYADDYYYNINSIMEKTNDITWTRYIKEVFKYPDTYGVNRFSAKSNESTLNEIMKMLNNNYKNIRPSSTLLDRDFTVKTFNSNKLTDEMSEISDSSGSIIKDKYYQILIEQGYKNLKQNTNYEGLWNGLTGGYEHPYVNGIWAENNEMMVEEKMPDVADKIQLFKSDVDIDTIIKGIYSINSNMKYDAVSFGSESYWQSNFASLYGSTTSSSYFGPKASDLFGEDIQLSLPLLDEYTIDTPYGVSWIGSKMVKSDSQNYKAEVTQDVFVIAEGIVQNASKKDDGTYFVSVEYENPDSEFGNIIMTYEGLNEVTVEKGDMVTADISETDTNIRIIGTINADEILKVSAFVNDGSIDIVSVINRYNGDINELMANFFNNFSYATKVGEFVWFDKIAYWALVDTQASVKGQCVGSVKYELSKRGLPIPNPTGNGIKIASNAIAMGSYHSWGKNPNNLKEGSIISVDCGTEYGHTAFINEVDDEKVCIINANIHQPNDDSTSHGDVRSECYRKDEFGGRFHTGGWIVEIAVPN